MKPYSIQHLDTTLINLSFTANWDYNPEKNDSFDFHGVELSGFSDIEDLKTKGTQQFAVRLGIKVKNVEGKACPYTFNIEVGGLFEVSKKVVQENLSQVVKQYGCHTLHVVIREIISNLSVRGVFGPIQLPTMHFPIEIESEKKTPSSGKLKKARDPLKKPTN